MKIQNTKGYSIIEILVYLAIFASLSILVINSFIIILSSFNTTSINRKLLESGSVVMERVSREIRQAKTVNNGSILGSNPGFLYLDSTDGGYVKFKKENDGLLKIYLNSATGDNLLSQHVTVTSLIFRKITTTKSEAVKVEMILRYYDGKNTKDENFYDTIVLRGGY